MRSLLPAALLACGLIASTGCGEVLNSADAGPSGTDADSVDALANLPDATPPDPCTGNVDAADMAGCFIETVCATMNRCYGTFPSVEECVAAGGPFANSGNRRGGPGARGKTGSGGETFVITLRRLVDFIGASTVIYDGTKAGMCLESIANVSCPDLYFNGDPTNGPACKQTFTGTVADTGSCFNEEECAAPEAACNEVAGASCDLQCCAGTCDDPHALGDDCSDNYRCEPGLHCVNAEDTTPPKCETGALNAPCWSYGDCDEGFWCEFPGAGGRGQCKADFPAAANCTEDAQCPRPQRCVGNDLSGTPPPIGACAPVHTEGAACDGFCDGPFYCDWPDARATGTCKPYPDLNEDCSQTFLCRGQLWCDDADQTCKPRKSNGVTCDYTGQCAAPLFCTTDVGVNPGSCRAPQADGNLCNSGYHCDSGVCAGDGVTPGLYQCTGYGNCR